MSLFQPIDSFFNFQTRFELPRETKPGGFSM